MGLLLRVVTVLSQIFDNSPLSRVETLNNRHIGGMHGYCPLLEGCPYLKG